jgi:hypothetical protein
MEAMKHDVAQANQDMIKGMTFFFTVVIPCVCPDIASKKDGSSHVAKFAGSWDYEMATGLLLLREFSNINNLQHNVALLVHDSEDGHNTNKKKRKRLHTTKDRENLCYCYYKMVAHLKVIMKLPGFDGCMDDWDRKCYGEKNRSARRGPETRPNMVPLRHQGNADDEIYFCDFLRDNPSFIDLFSGFSTASPVSPSEGGSDTASELATQSPFTAV